MVIIIRYQFKKAKPSSPEIFNRIILKSVTFAVKLPAFKLCLHFIKFFYYITKAVNGHLVYCFTEFFCCICGIPCSSISTVFKIPGGKVHLFFPVTPQSTGQFFKSLFIISVSSASDMSTRSWPSVRCSMTLVSISQACPIPPGFDFLFWIIYSFSQQSKILVTPGNTLKSSPAERTTTSSTPGLFP